MSLTNNLGGRRATAASIGTQRPPAEKSTLRGLPRQLSDWSGKRSALPSNKSNVNKRPCHEKGQVTWIQMFEQF